MQFGLLHEMQRPFTDKDLDWNALYKETLEQCKLAEWQGSPVRPGVDLTGEKLVDNLDYRDQLILFEGEQTVVDTATRRRFFCAPPYLGVGCSCALAPSPEGHSH